MIIVTSSTSDLIVRLDCYADDYAFNANLDEPSGNNRTFHSRSVVGVDFLEWVIPARSTYYSLVARATRNQPLPVDNDRVLFSMLVLQDNLPAPTYNRGRNPEERLAVSVQDGLIYVANFDLDVYKV